jgi:hypothetical protein
VEDGLNWAAGKMVGGRAIRISRTGSSPGDFTKPEAGRIIDLARREGDARTLWQLVNGGTAVARSTPHADQRVAFERRMGRLLSAA